MTTRRRRGALGLCLSLAGALGCDSGESIPIEDLPAAAQDAVCTRAVRCGEFPDQATCKGALFFRMQVQADVAAGKIIYNGKAAADCLHAYAAFGCKLSTLTTAPRSCDDAFRGLAGIGVACLIDEDCVSGRCDTSACNGATCCAGMCQGRGAVGAACTDSAGCVESAFCRRDVSGLMGTCLARLTAGQECTDFDECVPGTFCLVSETSATRTCIEPPGPGRRCPGGLCDDSTNDCNPVSQTCVLLVPVGGSCDGMLKCVRYATCDPATLTCVARIPVGGACSAPGTCIGGLPCDNGTCSAPPDEPACP